MKRKLPLAFKLQGICQRENGVIPFKKQSTAMKKKVRACVARKMHSSMGSKKK